MSEAFAWMLWALPVAGVLGIAAVLIRRARARRRRRGRPVLLWPRF
jgi:cytochrome c-type biogenesis protein CcmH/NrfF